MSRPNYFRYKRRLSWCEQDRPHDLDAFAATGRYGAGAYPRIENVLSLLAKKHAPDAELAIHLKDNTDDIEVALRDLAMKIGNEINEWDLIEFMLIFFVSVTSTRWFQHNYLRRWVGLSVEEAANILDWRHQTVHSYNQVRSGGFDVMWANKLLGPFCHESFIVIFHLDEQINIWFSPNLHCDTALTHPEAHIYDSRWYHIASIGVD